MTKPRRLMPAGRLARIAYELVAIAPGAPWMLRRAAGLPLDSDTSQPLGLDRQIPAPRTKGHNMNDKFELTGESKVRESGTVQYHEIVAWVNPEAWVDEAEAMRVVEAIAESGTDDEAEWVRIAGGSPDDVAAAAARDFDRAATAGTEVGL